MAPSTASSDSGAILSAAADGERWRRRRALARRLSRLAPAVAAGLLFAAVLVRFTGVPVAAFWTLSVLAGVGAGWFAWLAGRMHAVTDADAARMDADAQLGGELRSAHWFASRPEGDPWTSYHLAGAAERVRQVSWPSVYPPVAAARAWAGSAVLGTVALAVVLTGAWPLASRITAAPPPAGSIPAAGRGVSKDLQKQIDDLLNAVNAGAIPMDEARERVSDLRDALSKVDPALQAAVAKAVQEQARKPSGGEAKPADPEAAKLAARAEKAADAAALPEDMKWSLQDLAAKLAKASSQAASPDSQTPPEAKNGRAGDTPPPADAAASSASVQMVRMKTAEAQTDPMMASGATPAAGDPQGSGADAARKASASQPLDLSGALRKEAVEAAADSEGANVLAEMRRKSEQSRSTLAFSHVAPLAAYDPSRAAPPPPPPDALRPLVQQYFIRR